MGYHWDFGHIVIIQLGYSVRNHVRWNIIGNIMVHDLQICAAFSESRESRVKRPMLINLQVLHMPTISGKLSGVLDSWASHVSKAIPKSRIERNIPSSHPNNKANYMV